MENPTMKPYRVIPELTWLSASLFTIGGAAVGALMSLSFIPIAIYTIPLGIVLGLLLGLVNGLLIGAATNLFFVPLINKRRYLWTVRALSVFVGVLGVGLTLSPLVSYLGSIHSPDKRAGGEAYIIWVGLPILMFGGFAWWASRRIVDSYEKENKSLFLSWIRWS